MKWTKSSWKEFQINQQPVWPDREHLDKIISELSKLPSLVFSGETRKLSHELKNVNKEQGFILQVGNCAESFSDCNGPKIHNFLRIMLQMSMVLEYKTNKKVIKIGRIAGQYAKPRSSNFEIINGVKIPCYRGDNVNEFNPTIDSRIPNPERLLEGYFRSASTLNLIRAFIQGGYNDINNLRDWQEHFFSKEISQLDYYKKFAIDITDSLKNINNGNLIDKKSDQIYTSHEGLLLDYEEAFTRLDTTCGGSYDTSGHFIWIGDRTRQIDSAHVEFVRGIGNPIGIKIGPNYEIGELIDLIRRVNPENREERLVLISRMGTKQVNIKLKPLLKAIKENALKVIWICDPMHGNTFTHNNFKVRSFNDVVDEIKSFFHICYAENVVPGGIHLEITAENVSECIGGINGLTLSNLSDNYVTKVDPRLNAAQALEIAFIVSELLNNRD